MKRFFKFFISITTFTFIFVLFGPVVLNVALNRDQSIVINAAYPPPVPTITSPANKAVLEGDSINFQWDASEGASRYQLEVQKVDHSIFKDREVGNITNLTVDEFPADGTEFKWRVRAGNETDWSSWSDLYLFTNIAGEEAIADPDPAPVDRMLGDVNGDAVINVFDLVLTMRYVLGVTTLDQDQKIAADVNRDGSVNKSDVLLIIQHILEKIDSFD